MALQVTFTVAENLFNGTQLLFTDTTGDYSATNPGGYGTPNPDYSDIFATRFIWDDYYWDLDLLSSQTAVLADYEYQALTTNNYDSKVVPANAIYIPRNNNNLSTSQYATQTGRRLINTTFLPTQGYYTFVNTQFGLASSELFVDTVKSLQYEVYGGATVTSGNIVAGQQYIVVAGGNTDANHIVYNNSGNPGGTYYNGDVFTGILGQTNFSTGGTAYVYKLLSVAKNYFPLTYWSELYWRQALHKANAIGASSVPAQQQANQMYVDLQTIYNQYVVNAYQPLPIDTQSTIYYIQDIAIKWAYVNQLK
jgi:hypothetical protein